MFEINGNLYDGKDGLTNIGLFQSTIIEVRMFYLTRLANIFSEDIDLYIDNATAGSGCTPIITPVLGKILVMKLGISNESQKGQIAFQFAHEYMHYIFYCKYGIAKKLADKREETICTAASLIVLYNLYPGEFMLYDKYVRECGKEKYVGGADLAMKVNYDINTLGEGFDVLIIDEAQEYQDDQESALKYVVTDSKNPQTIFCGTPPTPVSSGTVFTKYRKATLEGRNVDSGWAEWSVEEKTDPRDIEAWYETNPSLGTVFTERSVTAEIGDDDIDFNIQRLGLWIRYNQKSAISETEWNELKAHVKPELTGELYVGIKYSKDGNVAMAIASKTEEGKIFVECIDCREVRAGDTWMLAYLKGWKARKVVIDGASGQQLLEEEMREYGIKNAHLPTVKEIIAANAKFEQGLYQRSIVHSGQPSLVQAVSNCEKRAIGSNGGFGYKAIKEEIEIALLDSVILAYWACSETKVKRRKQRISC